MSGPRLFRFAGIDESQPGIACYVVDAFTSVPFRGNPAAVCPLRAFLPDATLLAIAQENALSETAFFVPRSDGAVDLRWFTPEAEVDLCGHATLATAHVLLSRLERDRASVTFHTRSGPLTVARGDGHGRYRMDFPRRTVERIEVSPAMEGALGVQPREAYLVAGSYLLVVDDARTLEALKPDMIRVSALDARSVMVTARGEGSVDFVSRYFAPKVGIAEDPVTGSAHCALAPYWSEQLGKTKLIAEQRSRRGGQLVCEVHADRVVLEGSAVWMKTGVLHANSILERV
jgi:PhzF family phenazine biosynthesis protein